MIISYCVPCHNRAYDLKIVMPSLIEAANASPPVEIAILDYNSPDDLAEYMAHTIKTAKLKGGNIISYKKYAKGKYYSQGHARNLNVLASIGEFVLISGADHILDESYFEVIRELLKGGDRVWLYPSGKGGGIFGCDRKEFIEAGGFDERLKYYGKEDKDLVLRLRRRGEKNARVPIRLTTVIRTPKSKKYKDLQPDLSKKEMDEYSRAVYDENIANKVLVANKAGWGSWE